MEIKAFIVLNYFMLYRDKGFRLYNKGHGIDPTLGPPITQSYLFTTTPLLQLSGSKGIYSIELFHVLPRCPKASLWTRFIIPCIGCYQPDSFHI